MKKTILLMAFTAGFIFPNILNAAPVSSSITPPFLSHENYYEELGNNKDFHKLHIIVYDLLQMVANSNSEKLYMNYFKGNLDDFEKSQLLSNLRLTSEKEFKLIHKQIAVLIRKIQFEFKDVFNLPNTRELLQKASDLVVNKNQGILRPTPAQCWQTFLIDVAACNSMCLSFPDWESCYLDCFALMSSIWGLCQLLAE